MIIWRHRIAGLLVGGLAALALCACGIHTIQTKQNGQGSGQTETAGTNDLAPDGSPRLKVVTTIFPPYDFVRQIGGEYADVQLLLKPGMEAHSYEPSPRDIIAITDSALFVYTGGESDYWVEEILGGTDRNVNACKMLDWVNALEEETAEGMQLREHAHEAEEEYDEHIWTSPANCLVIVERIKEAMIAADPGRAGIYEENAAAFLDQLKALDQSFKDVTAKGSRNTIVFGDRFPFLYFIKEYGLSYYAAFPGCSMETEPSAAMVAFLTDKVKQDKIPVIFYLELSTHKVADAIAESAGVRTMEFHSCHTPTRDEMERGETYLSLMEKNLEALNTALNE